MPHHQRPDLPPALGGIGSLRVVQPLLSDTDGIVATILPARHAVRSARRDATAPDARTHPAE